MQISITNAPNLPERLAMVCIFIEFLIITFLFVLIELLERVLFRLGTAETDEQLETTVNKFLTPVLLKITSPNEAVRCKVRPFLR